MQRHNLQQRTAQEIVRASNQSLKLQKWGFVIIRSTYSSQRRWERFISILQIDTLQTLQNEADSDLSASFVLDVVEDEGALDGVDYKVARARFDTWVGEDLQAETDAGTDRKDFPAYMTAYQRYFQRINDQPGRGFFIFADQEVVDSVVDASETTLAIEKQRQVRGAGYFIKVVRSGIEEKREDEMDEDEDEDDGEDVYGEEEDLDSRRNVLQRFKAWDLLRLYASILRGGWPNEHLNMGDGVCDIMGL